MKKTALLLAFLACSIPLFSYEGMLAGQHDLKVIKTEYLDIIYTPGSEKSAAIIAEHGDDIYRELHATYNLTHEFRLPVTITSSQDLFNAYFTNMSYNHIVLFDTQPSIDMSVFEEDLLMIFRHELSHAITMSIKTPFWRIVNKIFGDGVNPVILVPTSGQLEGIAVLEESRHGEGRLNSEYARHFVKQAKIEDKFPNYGETTGARDIYLHDFNYKFGGEFMEYIHRTYGEERMVEFWNRMTNLGGLTYFTIFKSVYGISMKEAWEDFKEAVQAPDLPADPTESGEIFRFDSSRDFEQFSLVASAKDRLVYYNDSTATFYFLRKDGSADTGYTKPRGFLRQTGVGSMSLSADGRYLTYAYLSTAGALPKNRLVVYDFETKSKFSVPQDRLNGGVVFTLNEGGTETVYLAATRNVSQDSSINIFRLAKDRRGRISGMELVETIHNRFNNFSASLQTDEAGSIYYLSKEGVGYIIKSYNFVTKTHQRLNLPHQDMLIQDLSVSTAPDGTTVAYFSYVRPGTMPRLGEARIRGSQAEFVLYQRDISGGIFAPVSVGEGTIAFIGKFMAGNRLFTTDVSSIEPAAAEGQLEDLGVRSREENLAMPFVDTTILGNAKDFSIWPYLLPKTWIPLSSSASYYQDGGFILGTPSLLGVTFIGTTPWTSPNYTLSAGYNTGARSGTFQATVSGGTTTGLFRYAMSNNLEVDGKGYKQTYHKLAANSTIGLTNSLSLIVADTLDLFEGRQTLPREIDPEESLVDALLGIFNARLEVDERDVFFARNVAQIHLSYIPLTGKGQFEYLNFSVGSFLDIAYATDITRFGFPFIDYRNVGLLTQIHVPQLLPFATRTWGTWNLPLTVGARLYPAQEYFLEAQGNLVLFSFELQKAFNWFPIIFFNRITAELEYVGKFSGGGNDTWAIVNMPAHFRMLSAGQMAYSDELTARLALTLSPNFGSYTSNHPTLNCNFRYRFFPEQDQARFNFDLSFTVGL